MRILIIIIIIINRGDAITTDRLTLDHGVPCCLRCTARHQPLGIQVHKG